MFIFYVYLVQLSGDRSLSGEVCLAWRSLIAYNVTDFLLGLLAFCLPLFSYPSLFW